ncbi:MAG: hypothetical protein IPL40_14700 [Proteobacteria bacterium]|nr:hypothetical protein [Pseudomonadota bacterium]
MNLSHFASQTGHLDWIAGSSLTGSVETDQSWVVCPMLAVNGDSLFIVYTLTEDRKTFAPGNHRMSIHGLSFRLPEAGRHYVYPRFISTVFPEDVAAYSGAFTLGEYPGPYRARAQGGAGIELPTTFLDDHASISRCSGEARPPRASMSIFGRRSLRWVTGRAWSASRSRVA